MMHSQDELKLHSQVGVGHLTSILFIKKFSITQSLLPPDLNVSVFVTEQ